jgi:predicted nucleotidyltransferase
MKTIERQILETFKSSLLKRLAVHKIILFGSRARGDAEPYSDMDVLVVLDQKLAEHDSAYISDCAWESGFDKGIVVVPVVYSRDEWEKSPERYSLLAIAVEKEGVTI